MDNFGPFVQKSEKVCKKEINSLVTISNNTKLSQMFFRISSFNYLFKQITYEILHILLLTPAVLQETQFNAYSIS